MLIDKQKLKDGINEDYSRTTTNAPFYHGMRKAYHEILNDIDDGRFNSEVNISSLITTIESLQESFDKQVKGHQYTAKKLANEKVITALAIKALEPYAKKPNRDGGEKARLALAEIERLQNAQT